LLAQPCSTLGTCTTHFTTTLIFLESRRSCSLYVRQSSTLGTRTTLFVIFTGHIVDMIMNVLKGESMLVIYVFVLSYTMSLNIQFFNKKN
jgi:hypothetical protein